MSEENRAILDEVNRAGSWFAAVKTGPVWAKRNTETREIESREGMTTSHAGDMICRGPGGEIWTQTAEKFDEKYNPSGETDREGFEKFLPDPESTKVMAAQILHPFAVVTSWGKLDGKAGDYLIKSYEDRDKDYTSTAWIVGGEIFAQTYEKV